MKIAKCPSSQQKKIFSHVWRAIWKANLERETILLSYLSLKISLIFYLPILTQSWQTKWLADLSSEVNYAHPQTVSFSYYTKKIECLRLVPSSFYRAILGLCYSVKWYYFDPLFLHLTFFTDSLGYKLLDCH